MGAAAYNRGSRAISRQIAADFGLREPEEHRPSPRPAGWGDKAKAKALARARSILASSLRLGRVLDLEMLAGTVQMATRVGAAAALEAARRAMDEAKGNVASLDDLVDELNRVAEYAGFRGFHDIPSISSCGSATISL